MGDGASREGREEIDFVLSSLTHRNHYAHRPGCQPQAGNPCLLAEVGNVIDVTCSQRAFYVETRTILDLGSMGEARVYQLPRDGSDVG